MTATTTIRLDCELKRSCDAILDDIGISFTAAVTIFMNEVVRTGGIPFPVRSPKAIGPAKDLVRGEGVTPDAPSKSGGGHRG